VYGGFMQTIELIKKLRHETHQGMMACQQALIEADYDYDKAKALLESQTTKHEGNARVASKGLTRIHVKENQAILFEVNAETDFVSKNQHFLDVMDLLATHLIDSDANQHIDALKQVIDGKKVMEHLDYVSHLIQEKVVLRRFYRVEKQTSQGFGTYTHLGGKISTLVILSQDHLVLAKELAMQVASHNPKYLSFENIDQDTINYEAFMYEKEHPLDDHDLFIKHLKTLCLLEQPMLKNQHQTVKEVLEQQNIDIIDFFRFELGQGIEDKLNCKLDIPCDGSKITVTPIG